MPDGYVDNHNDYNDGCYYNYFDCNNVCGGNASWNLWYVDEDGDGLGNGSVPLDVCSDGAPVNYVANSDDDDDQCYWNFYDECGVCGGDGPDNGHNCDGDVCEYYDCEDVCNGNGIVDCNGECWSGEQSKVLPEDNLGNGTCNDYGLMYTPNFFCAQWNWDDGDCCGGCSEYFNPAGVCYIGISGWIGDGYCDSENNFEHCFYDEGDCCPGDCVDGDTYSCATYGGTCGDCIDPDSSNSNNQGDCEPDCAGVPGGSAYHDNCGDCDADPDNDCTNDCAGVPGGPATVDQCDVCDSNPSNDCAQDCAGSWGGTAVVDMCGSCDSNNSNDCSPDCAGTWGGSADEDNCNICSGGDSGHTANSDKDCHGTCFGSAFEDNCNNCVGGTTGYDPCSQDCAGVYGGLNVYDNCSTCDSDPSNDCTQDCAATWGGAAFDDGCGVCSGGNSGHGANSDMDCNGDCFGAAFNDDCNVCSGGNTSHGANSDKDCNGDCFGTSMEDCVDQCLPADALYGGGSWVGDGWCDNQAFSEYVFGEFIMPDLVCAEWEFDGGDCDDDCGIPLGGNDIDEGVGPNLDCMHECYGVAQFDDCGVCDTDSSNDGPANCDYCDDDINRDQEIDVADALAWVDCVVFDNGCPEPEDATGGECNTRSWVDVTGDGTANVFDILKIIEGILASMVNDDACYVAPSSNHACDPACFDGIDNDGDGAKDCQDSDCMGSQSGIDCN